MEGWINQIFLSDVVRIKNVGAFPTQKFAAYAEQNTRQLRTIQNFLIFKNAPATKAKPGTQYYRITQFITYAVRMATIRQ